jgi:DNA-binding CsgD family transcriptional regulator
MLEPLHLSPDDERLYRELLRTPAATAAQLAHSAGCPVPHARATLGHLVEMRLVQRRPGRPVTFQPTPPDVAIAARVNELQADLDKARLAIPDLLHEYQRGRASIEPSGLVEVQTGPQIEQRRGLEIRSLATDELLVMGDAVDVPLRPGLRCRGIYEAALLEVPGQLSHLRRLISHGEHARVAPRLPTRMIICDRRMAMLPLAAPAPGGSESVVLVNPSSLLDALIELFEDYWQRSHPVSAAQDTVSGLSTADLETLRLLGTGMKDEAIARQLGVSMRTARRRITALLTRLGAASRFQAGAEAARRGYV